MRAVVLLGEFGISVWSGCPSVVLSLLESSEFKRMGKVTLYFVISCLQVSKGELGGFCKGMGMIDGVVGVSL